MQWVLQSVTILKPHVRSHVPRKADLRNHNIT